MTKVKSKYKLSFISKILFVTIKTVTSSYPFISKELQSITEVNKNLRFIIIEHETLEVL